MDPFLLDSLFKLFLAALLGSVIGFEREKYGRPAGLRTHALVCVASALLIVTTRLPSMVALSPGAAGHYNLNIDPARMAAGIVTGIGFLGAGAILHLRESLVRGLTTAACIWFVAAIGIAIGFDAYLLAVAAVAMAIGILVLLNRVEGMMEQGSYRNLIIRAESGLQEEIDRSCQALFDREQITFHKVSYQIDNLHKEFKLALALRLRTRRDQTDLISDIGRIPGVRLVRWC